MRIIKKAFLTLSLISLCVLLLTGCDYLDSIPVLGDLFGGEEPDVAPHEHTLVDHEAKAPTCTEIGWQAYQTCSSCDEYTTYSPIDPLGHEYSDEYISSGDHHSRFCVRCTGSMDQDHEWIEGAFVSPPQCEKAGSQLFSCSVCSATKVDSVASLGHDYSDTYVSNGDTHSRSCSRCSHITDTKAHVWVDESVISAATCELEGLTKYTCSDCGEEKTEILSELGHDYSDVFRPNGAVHSLFCSRCSASTGDAEHEWKADKVITAPTCISVGTQLYACEICHITKGVILDETDHTYSNEYMPNGDIHSRYCTGCGISIADGEHEWIADEIISAPSCTSTGVQIYKCTACKDTKEVLLEKNKHTPSDEYKPNGDVHSICCTECGTALEDGAHEWGSGEVLKAPTCAEDGITGYSCSICNLEKTELIPKTGEHIDGGWEVVRMPTATERGKEQLRCAVCEQVIYDREIACDADSMPILYFTGDYTAATNAKNEVPMTVSLVYPDGTSIDGYAKIKVQGSSSVAYPKKNYTVKLYKDSEYDSKYKVDLGWGKENKYVIKANWVDFSSARNVVSCRLWGDMVKTRPESEIQQRLAALKTNGGAIDGFAVAVYMNGAFHGLYTLNVPKDEWMFDMGDSDTEALLSADDWNNTDFNVLLDGFVEQSNGDITSNGGGWELRYCGTDDYSWVTDSFNDLILFVQNNDGEAFRQGISQYLDVDAAIDYVIHMYAVFMRDNSSKNMLWATYDGKVWIPSVYDQDGTFGQSWDGVNAAPSNGTLPYYKNGKINVGVSFGPNAHPINFILWERILNCFTEEVLLRYRDLRQTVLSTENIIAELKAFEATVPASIYEADRIKWASGRESWWTGKRGQGVWYEKFHFEYMYTWVEDRMTYLDNAMRDIYNNAYLPNTDDPAL